MWIRDDFEWFITVPSCYYGDPGEKMPRQGDVNAGQRLWQLVIIGTGMVFVVTGATLWSFK
jgi:cytochrome b subunit of formate dehydrogenase